MKTTQEKFDQLLKSWSIHRESLYKILKPFHVRLVYQRLMNRKTFKELGVRYELNESSAKMLFDWIINRIKERVNREFASEIEDCHAFINASEARSNK